MSKFNSVSFNQAKDILSFHLTESAPAGGCGKARTVHLPLKECRKTEEQRKRVQELIDTFKDKTSFDAAHTPQALRRAADAAVNTCDSEGWKVGASTIRGAIVKSLFPTDQVEEDKG